MLAASVALLVLATSPRNVVERPLHFSSGSALWLAAGTIPCWLAVRYRFAWLVAVPALVTIASTGTSLAVVTRLGPYAVLVTSLTMLVGRRYWDPVQGRLAAPFLAACSGWATAFAILVALGAANRQGEAWSAPLLLVVVATGLGLMARAQRSKRASDAVAAGKLNERAYWRGFLTLFGVAAITVAAVVIVHLPRAGANSGSAAPGAWQPR
jgi:hypothetical protein